MLFGGHDSALDALLGAAHEKLGKLDPARPLPLAGASRFDGSGAADELSPIETMKSELAATKKELAAAKEELAATKEATKQELASTNDKLAATEKELAAFGERMAALEAALKR